MCDAVNQQPQREGWQHVHHSLSEVTHAWERSQEGSSGHKPLKPTRGSCLQGSLKGMNETKAENLDIVTSYFTCGFAGEPQPSSNLSSTAGRAVQETASSQYNIVVGREPQNSSITLTLIS